MGWPFSASVPTECCLSCECYVIAEPCPTPPGLLCPRAPLFRVAPCAVYDCEQERMIIRGGGRACNFVRFGNGRDNPPVEGARNTWRNFVPLCSVRVHYYYYNDTHKLQGANIKKSGGRMRQKQDRRYVSDD